MNTNSLLKMNNQIFTSKSFESVMMNDTSSFSTENYIIGDERFASECEKIINTRSYEALDKEFVRDCNDLSFSIGMFNNQVQRFAHDRVVVKNFLKQFGKADYATEAANDMICTMSLENAKAFFGRTWAWIKEQFKKLALMALKVAKMFANFIRGKVASLQSSTYTKLAASLPQLLKAHGSEKVKYRKFTGDVSKNISAWTNNIDKLVSDLNDMANKIDQDPSKVNGKEFKLFGITFFKYGQAVKVDSIVKSIGKAVGGNISLETNALNTTVVVNKIFYGSEKKPAAGMYMIKDALTTDSFKTVSKEWLKNLDNLVKSTTTLSKQCSNLIKKVEKIEQGAKALAGTKDGKAAVSERIKALNNIRAIIQVLEMFVREFFWAALDYRSTMYRLAKACNKGEKKSQREAKKAEKK